MRKNFVVFKKEKEKNILVHSNVRKEGHTGHFHDGAGRMDQYACPGKTEDGTRETLTSL